MVYTCREHLEEAIDEFLVKNEESPDIEVLLETKKEVCFFCKGEATIELKACESTDC